MKVRYSYLAQQFADCDDLWLQLTEFVKLKRRLLLNLKLKEIYLVVKTETFYGKKSKVSLMAGTST